MAPSMVSQNTPSSKSSMTRYPLHLFSKKRSSLRVRFFPAALLFTHLEATSSARRTKRRAMASDSSSVSPRIGPRSGSAGIKPSQTLRTASNRRCVPSPRLAEVATTGTPSSRSNTAVST